MTADELRHWGKKTVIMDGFIAVSASTTELHWPNHIRIFGQQIGIGG